MMRKIALISRRSPSDWISCRSITQNLIKSYRFAFPQAESAVFFMEESFAFVQFDQLARQIEAFGPDAIVVVDHQPHPGTLIKLLARRFENWPRLVIHVFGDFTLKPNQWIGVERELQKANPLFICASEKQQKLVRSFLKSNDDGALSTAWIPFPVDRETFSFQSTRAEQARATAGISGSDKVLLYAGRLSLQKNVLFLMRSFAGYLQFNPNALLWLAGPIDDLGIPYIGKVPPRGLLSWDLVDLKNSLVPAARQHQIRYLGDQDAQGLGALYSLCDAFVSFSTHSDEDFGMAPAEAACCGAPLILSAWGGYSSFATMMPETVCEIPVSIDGRRILPNVNASIKAIAATLARSRSSADRALSSDKALGLLSCEAVGRKLRETLASKPGRGSEFAGFSHRFQKLAQAYRMNSRAPFRAAEGYSSLFRELYEHYF